MEEDAKIKLEIEQALVRLLASREHSQAELRRKLEGRFPDDALGAVLDALAVRGLQSDERFTEQYVAMRTRKGYGPLRIRAELRDKGVATELIESWLDPRDPAWPRHMREVAAQKFGSEPANDRKEMARRGRFLEYRGFPAEMIRAYLFD